MADLRRLGRRGSYRLGRLAPPPSRPTLPGVHYPSFARRHRGPAGLWLLASAAALVATAAAALAGWWYLPLAVGLAGGLAAGWGRWRLRASIPAIIVITAGGWGAALVWLTAQGLPERPVAREIAALAGLPAHASVAVAAALVVAALQGLAGLWLGRALAPQRRPR